MKGVTFIRPGLAQEFTKDILTPETLTGFAEIIRTKVADGRTLEEVRRDLVEARPARQARLDAGEPIDFLPADEKIAFLDGTSMTVRQIREGDWKVDGQPKPFSGRHVQLTGPCSEPGMAIGAMNTGQQWMADSEDAAAQTTDSPLRTQRSLKLLCTWNSDGKRAIDGVGGKNLKPEGEVAIMIYRPRGLHLDDRHLLVDGQAVSGAFADAWLFLRHNAKSILDRGLPVSFYLPKLENVQEADLWHTFLYETEKALGLAPGTVKIFLLVEIINATYQLEEMMYAFTRSIRDGRTGKTVPASRFIGPNVGRWDYTASMYRMSRALPGIPPDTNVVTMDGARFLAVYEQYVSDMARKRGAVPWGGMSANILLRATVRPGDFEKIAGKEGAPALLGALQAAGYLDPKGNVTDAFTPGTTAVTGMPAEYEPHREKIAGVLTAFVARAYNNRVALEKASDDKARESGLRPAKDGGRRCYYGAWVATPDMVAVIQPIFEKAAGQGLLAALDRPPERTDWYGEELAAGLRAFPKGEVTEGGVREDITIALQYMASYLQGSAAAAVTSPQLKLQLMEDLATAEIRRAALWKRLHAGAVLQGEGPLSGKELTEEVFLRLLDEEAKKLKGDSVGTAREILRWATTSEKLIPWISDPLNVVLDETSPEVIGSTLKAYFDTYVTTGRRMTRVAGADVG